MLSVKYWYILNLEAVWSEEDKESRSFKTINGLEVACK